MRGAAAGKLATYLDQANWPTSQNPTISGEREIRTRTSHAPSPLDHLSKGGAGPSMVGDGVLQLRCGKGPSSSSMPRNGVKRRRSVSLLEGIEMAVATGLTVPREFKTPVATGAKLLEGIEVAVATD